VLLGLRSVSIGSLNQFYYKHFFKLLFSLSHYLSLSLSLFLRFCLFVCFFFCFFYIFELTVMLVHKSSVFYFVLISVLSILILKNFSIVSNFFYSYLIFCNVFYLM
jgi:hypothetical protein